MNLENKSRAFNLEFLLLATENKMSNINGIEWSGMDFVNIPMHN